MIEVYESLFADEPAETYYVTGTTIGAWLSETVPEYDERRDEWLRTWAVIYNGRTVNHYPLDGIKIKKGDSVDIRLLPKGGVGDAISSVVGAVVDVFNQVLGFLGFGAQTPDTGSARGSGSSIYNPNAQANQPKLGDPLPEIAGRHKTFPDYLCQPTRRFVDRRTQALDVMLCIGRGEYNLEELKIGTTDFDALGSTLDYAVFQPGASVTSHPAHRNWFNAPEVGQTTGSSGLRLKPAVSVQERVSASLYEFDGTTVTIPEGAGTIPSGWETGMDVFIDIYRDIDVVDGGSSGGVYERDEVRGDLSDLGLSVGDAITIRGAGPVGDYIVNSYTPDDGVGYDILTLDHADMSPATFLSPGAYLSAVDYTGVSYNIDGVIASTSVQFSNDFTGTQILGDFTGAMIYEGDSITIVSGVNAGTYTVDGTGSAGFHVPDILTETQYSTIVYNETDNAYTSSGVGQGLNVTRLIDGATDPGWSGFATQSTPDAQITLDTSSFEGDWAGPFQACPDNEATTYIEFDIFFPRGLAYLDEDIGSNTVRAEMQWRDKAVGGNWNTISLSYSDSTLDQIGFTESVTLPYAMVPEFRARRIGAERSDQTAERIEWYGLRSLLPPATSYEGVTTMALRVVGSDTISSQTENKISMIATRLLGYKGSTPQPERNIAPWVEYVAKDIGYTEKDINYEELDRLHDIWSSRGDFYDFVQEDTSTVKEVINKALRAGFAELTIQDAQLTPVRDGLRTEWDQQFFPASVQDAHMYTPQNYLSGGLTRTVNAPRPDDPDGVEVEYFDQNTWQTETVFALLPGDNAFRAEQIAVEGVVDRTRAWRIGMRYRRRLYYQRWNYSFSTELDALNSNYLGFVALSDNIPGYAQSSLIQDVADDGQGNTVLLLSEPMDFTTGTSHVIAYRRRDGTIAGPWEAQRGDEDYELITAIPASDRPSIDYGYDEPWPHALFGPAEQWCFPALIQSITPQGLQSVDVEAVNYDERVYQDDNNFPE